MFVAHAGKRVQRNPLFAAPHTPLLKLPSAHRMLLHAVQVPRWALEADILTFLRYCPPPHLGWATHLPSDDDDWPVRYSYMPGLHFWWDVHRKPPVDALHVPLRYWSTWHVTLLQVVHVPRAAGDAPRRNMLVLQVGWSLHRKSLRLPLQVPMRYWSGLHSLLRQRVQKYGANGNS